MKQSNIAIYIFLIRLNNPVGILLLLFPCLWGLALVKSEVFHLKEIILFISGSLLMRTSGCIYNDILDRKIDKHVERTSKRPIVSGQISIRKAIIILIIFLLLSMLILLQFNKFTIFLGLFSIFLVAIYPLTKKITNWPQLFLGITFNWGILLGWVSIRESLSYEPLILYMIGIFWTIGYDTIYAFQDIKYDLIIGVKSTAVLFKEKSSVFLFLLFYTMHFSFLLLGNLLKADPLFYEIWTILGITLYSQIFIFKSKDSYSALSIFRFNVWIGLIILICILTI